MRAWKGQNIKFGSHRLMLAVGAMTIVWLVGVALAASGTVSARASVNQRAETAGLGPGAAIPVGHAFALAGQAAPGRGQAPPPAGGQAAPARGGQAPSTSAPASATAGQMSQEVFKNVTALTNIPVDEFMQTMGVFSAALSMCCAECHTGAGTDTVRWEVDTPIKRTARRMV